MKLSLTDWMAISQICLTAIRLTGVVVSIWFSSRALREVQSDREFSQLPFLYFEPGGYRYPIEFVQIGNRIPGIDPEAAERLLSRYPANMESVLIKADVDADGAIKNRIDIGRLKNYGAGPAFSVKIHWVPKRVYFGKDSFPIDKEKQKEPLYRPGANIVSAAQSNLLPKEETGIVKLPLFIIKDYEKKISQVDGELLISCNDVFGKKRTFVQKFYLFTGYHGDPTRSVKDPYVHITFLDTDD